MAKAKEMEKGSRKDVIQIVKEHTDKAFWESELKGKDKKAHYRVIFGELAQEKGFTFKDISNDNLDNYIQVGRSEAGLVKEIKRGESKKATTPAAAPTLEDCTALLSFLNEHKRLAEDVEKLLIELETFSDDFDLEQIKMMLKTISEFKKAFGK